MILIGVPIGVPMVSRKADLKLPVKNGFKLPVKMLFKLPVKNV